VFEPTVGVAIAVRNGERWLAACLDSVLAQTLPATEIVVVDDGSDDATATIAARYAPLVRMRRIPRVGIGAARNLSFGLVQAELIVSVDADDLLTPFSVEVRVAALPSGSWCSGTSAASASCARASRFHSGSRARRPSRARCCCAATPSPALGRSRTGA
jgi:glycosyltransferase involved in cell wall biosynthesis